MRPTFFSSVYHFFSDQLLQDVATKYPPVQHLITLFKALENYSPFLEFLNDDSHKKVSQKEASSKKSPERVFTKEELKQYDGSIDGKRIKHAYLFC